MDIYSDSVKSQFYSPYSHYYYYYCYLAVLPLIIHMRNIRVDEVSQTVFASRFSDFFLIAMHATCSVHPFSFDVIFLLTCRQSDNL